MKFSVFFHILSLDNRHKFHLTKEIIWLTICHFWVHVVPLKWLEHYIEILLPSNLISRQECLHYADWYSQKCFKNSIFAIFAMTAITCLGCPQYVVVYLHSHYSTFHGAGDLIIWLLCVTKLYFVWQLERIVEEQLNSFHLIPNRFNLWNKGTPGWLTVLLWRSALSFRTNTSLLF